MAATQHPPMLLLITESVWKPVYQCDTFVFDICLKGSSDAAHESSTTCFDIVYYRLAKKWIWDGPQNGRNSLHSQKNHE